MKIPETSANVAAYYGNDENGQWQGNGVTIDGGGSVAGGDAGFLPMYPPPRGMHDPGYVITGAYYPSGYQPPPLPPQPGLHPHPHPLPHQQHQPHAVLGHPSQHQMQRAPDDFADYLWMENEEEFDKQVMQELEEEALMEQCIEAMLEDERERDRRRPQTNGQYRPAPSNGGAPVVSLQEQVLKSKLNPLAAEFVPTGVRSAPALLSHSAAPTAPDAPAQKPEVARCEEKDPPPAEAPPIAAEDPKKAEAEPTAAEDAVDTPTDASPPTPPAPVVQPEIQAPEVQETPEVSAADFVPNATCDNQSETPEESSGDVAPPKSCSANDAKRPPRDARRDGAKRKPMGKPATPPAPAPTNKGDVVKARDGKRPPKGGRSEIEDVVLGGAIVEQEKTPPPLPPLPPLQQQQTEEASSAPKPINYAAAAKANKPKRPSPAPSAVSVTDNGPSNSQERIPLPSKSNDKMALPAKSSAQRKGSAK